MTALSRLAVASGILILSGLACVSAQETRTQSIPNTAFLDLQAVTRSVSGDSILPGWLESVEFADRTSNPNVLGSGSSAHTGTQAVWRLRLREAPDGAEQLLFRLTFRDETGKQPSVTVWTELGEKLLSAESLGSGIGIPTSETLIVPAKGAAYMEIQVPGDGANLRTAVLSALKPATTLHAVDFDPLPMFSDPFQNPLPATATAGDIAVLGRVKAPLDRGTVKLTPGNEDAVEFAFELVRAPLAAMVSFEVLNADISHPPLVLVNDEVLGQASLVLPDLADPAYAGAQYAMDASMRFRYNGWVKAQCVIPGAMLAAGENKLTLRASEHADAFAVRAPEIQLKYTNPAATP